MKYHYNKNKFGEEEKSAFQYQAMKWKDGSFHSPTVRMFAERKWQQFPSWRMDSSLGVKSPAADFGEVRAISSFQSSLATVLAPSQTKHFSADICRKFQSSSENIWEKAAISGCCCFSCFGSASECLLWNSTSRRLSWFSSFDTYSTHWTTEFAVSAWRKTHGAQSWQDGCEGPSQEHRSHKHSVNLPSVSCMWQPWRRHFFKLWELLELWDVYYRNTFRWCTMDWPQQTEGTKASFPHPRIFHRHRQLHFCQQQLLQEPKNPCWG